MEVWGGRSSIEGILWPQDAQKAQKRRGTPEGDRRWKFGKRPETLSADIEGRGVEGRELAGEAEAIHPTGLRGEGLTISPQNPPPRSLRTLGSRDGNASLRPV